MKADRRTIATGFAAAVQAACGDPVVATPQRYARAVMAVSRAAWWLWAIVCTAAIALLAVGWIGVLAGDINTTGDLAVALLVGYGLYRGGRAWQAGT